MHTSPASTQQRGLTLIEAAIALAIVAAGAATVAPAFQELVARKRLEGAAARLASELQGARTEAVARNVPLRISFHTDAGGSCYLVHTGARALCSCTAAAASCSAEAVLVSAMHLPAAQGVTVSASATSILFDPVHGTSTPAATARLTAAQGAIHHVVNVMGRVRTCSPAGRLPGYRAC